MFQWLELKVLVWYGSKCLNGGVWCVGSLAGILCLWAFWSTAQISPCPGVSDQSKFSLSKVYGPNHQQSNWEEKKNPTISRLKKMTSFYQDARVNQCRTLSASLWTSSSDLNEYFFQIFILNYKNYCGTCVDLPYSRLASWRWKELGLLRY